MRGETFQSVNAALTTGAGDSHDFIVAPLDWGIQATFTGSPTNCVVTLEGSLEGSSWFTLATWTKASQTSGDIIFAVDKPARYARANVTSFSAGAGNNVSAWICGG